MPFPVALDNKEDRMTVSQLIDDGINIEGLFVEMIYRDPPLLGNIKGIVEDSSGKRLIIHHFNGEEWPCRPSPDEVSLI